METSNTDDYFNHSSFALSGPSLDSARLERNGFKRARTFSYQKNMWVSIF